MDDPFDFIKNLNIGDEVRLVINGKPDDYIVKDISEKVLKILNPSGVVIEIPTIGEFELG